METPTPRNEPAAESDQPPLTRHQARLEAARLAKIERDKARFAQPGGRGPLFTYALPTEHEGGVEHHGDFAVIDFETTGFSPANGDRIVEIAVARISATGELVEEFATLVNPEGRDTGPAHVHGISNEDVLDAPTFAQAWPEVLRLLDGAVVVAHNAAFEEKFLAHELQAAGFDGLHFHSVCTLSWSRATMTTPNHKLVTVVEAAGIDFPGQHTALGDVRATAKLFPLLAHWRGRPATYAEATPRHAPGHSGRGTEWNPITRLP